MQYPLFYNGILFDLRTIPLFIISYRLGFKSEISTSILPIIYRLYLGRNAFIQEILLSILLPIILSYIFNKENKTNHLNTKINIKKLKVYNNTNRHTADDEF